MFLKINRKSWLQSVNCSHLNILPLTGAPCTQFSFVCRACSLSQFRWKAQLPEDRDNKLVETASLKLVNGEDLDDQKKDHVFVVLSQQLCIKLVIEELKAFGLADRSVAHHMRLITGISEDHRTFYTYSPSKPILVLVKPAAGLNV